MKYIHKIFIISTLISFGILQAFGGNRRGSDPATYTPGPANQNYFRFTANNLAPLIINGATIDTSDVYGIYYPLLQTITLKDINQNTMRYKFENVIISTEQQAPQGTQLIASYNLPAGINSFANMTQYVYGTLVK